MKHMRCKKDTIAKGATIYDLIFFVSWLAATPLEPSKVPWAGGREKSAPNFQ